MGHVGCLTLPLPNQTELTISECTYQLTSIGAKNSIPMLSNYHYSPKIDQIIGSKKEQDLSKASQFAITCAAVIIHDPDHYIYVP